MTFYTRKATRIPNYDYSSCNYYFLTICTHNRRCIFGEPAALNVFGKIAEEQMQRIAAHYDGVYVDKYVVMPNHVHLILKIEDTDHNFNVSQIIAQYKSGVSRQIRQIDSEMQIWQRSFHDHIIRNQKSYESIWNYIDGNPQCWEKDCFYVDQSVLRNKNYV